MYENSCKSEDPPYVMTRFCLVNYQVPHISLIGNPCIFLCQKYVLYSAKRWQGKTLVNRSFQSFGEENVGEFNLLTNS